MSKRSNKKPVINLDHIEDSTDNVFALIGAKIVAKDKPSDVEEPPDQSVPEQDQPDVQDKSTSTPVTSKKPRSKKGSKPSTDTHNDALPNLTNGELTEKQLQWFFTDAPKDNGTVQIRLSKETKDALFYVANGGGIAGSQLADNVIKWWIRTYMKPIRKFIKHDPLNSL